MEKEANIQQISPGVCPPEGCPPATRIECISVDKVYDSCFQVDDRTRSTVISSFFPLPFVGEVIPCSLTEGLSISCEVLQKTPVNATGFFNLSLLVRVPLTLTNPEDPNDTEDRVFTFTKNVTLCCPEGTFVDCSESTLLFCHCVVTASTNGPVTPPAIAQVTPIGEITVECNFQVCLVIKCLARVQLLVPSYGFCVPAPCVTLPGVCPPTPPAQCF